MNILKLMQVNKVLQENAKMHCPEKIEIIYVIYPLDKTNKKDKFCTGLFGKKADEWDKNSFYTLDR